MNGPEQNVPHSSAQECSSQDQNVSYFSGQDSNVIFQGRHVMKQDGQVKHRCRHVLNLKRVAEI